MFVTMPALMKRTHVQQIFGFKHTMSHAGIQFNPDEQISLRHRLFVRAIRINGVSQLKTLHPYLEARLGKTIENMVDPKITTEGSKLSLGS